MIKNSSSQILKDHQNTNSNFIREIIDRDLAEGKHKRIITRFPPEPNGYLHIGHAKSIVLNFGIAQDYDGECHLRFDDTNPETENEEYIRSIKETVAWLGFDWGDHLYFASDYFDQFFQYAIKLIEAGKAYVDSQSTEEIRETRGSVNEPGTSSPYRDRRVDENLAIFQEMRDGKYGDGEHVLRAKIDMASPHMILRDPLLYRIRHAHHYRQGDDWCIYPMYDFAHPLEDAIENITHSLCTLEFDTNRVLYDWVLDNCLEPEELPTRPHQYEFSRLNLTYTIMSKRKLLKLVQEDLVDGWDDPRVPTIAGLRRRGVTPDAIREFCQNIGVTRTESIVEMSHFEHTLRDSLNAISPRVNAVINPLKVVVTNFPEDKTDWIEGAYWPRDIDKEGARKIPFTRNIYIERDDFREAPPSGFHRLAPGREVRLRYGYFITCKEVVKNEDGEILEIHCTYDPETRGGDAPDGRSPKGTLHWVAADHAIPAEFRLYNRLFSEANPESGDGDFMDHLNPNSLETKTGYIEPSVADDNPETRYQFERVGYFWRDQEDSTPENLIFNQIISLRDTWAEQDEAERAAEIERLRQEKEREKELQRQRSQAGDRDLVEDLTTKQRGRFQEYVEDYGLNRDDAALIARDDELSEFFEKVNETYETPTLTANWIVNQLMAVMKDQSLGDLLFGAGEFAQLMRLIDEEAITSSGAGEVFEILVNEGGEPESIVDEKGLRQVDDTAVLAAVVEQILQANPDEVARYKDGNTNLLGFFMGQVMRETTGAANPEIAKQLLQEKLEKK